MLHPVVHKITIGPYTASHVSCSLSPHPFHPSHSIRTRILFTTLWLKMAELRANVETASDINHGTTWIIEGWRIWSLSALQQNLRDTVGEAIVRQHTIKPSSSFFFSRRYNTWLVLACFAISFHNH